MKLTLFLLSFGGLIGIYFNRYLEMVRGTKTINLLKRLYKKIFKIRSKHLMVAKKTAASKTEPIQKAKINQEELKEKQEGDFEEADRIFNKADYLLARGEKDEAKKLLIQALSLNAGHEGANHKLGSLYISDENFSKAEMIYLLLTELFPRNPRYQSQLALTYYQQKKLDKARDTFEKATTIDNTRPEYFISLAYIYDDLNDNVYAVKNFQKAREIDPRNSEILLAFSKYYIRQNQQEAARKLLKTLLEYSPQHEEAQKILKDLV